MALLDFKYMSCSSVPNSVFIPVSSFEAVNDVLEKEYHLNLNDFYLVSNGKCLGPNDIAHGVVTIHPRLLGGKGGFGSMLRAIGAQIEKTTNREACRDLSGRRLRDINEEQRLKKWISQQAEREREILEKKKRKLEKLCQEPRFEFKDKNYDSERSTMTDNLFDAVEQGIKASTSGTKRPAATSAQPKKKKKLLLDLDDSDSSDDSSSESETPSVSSSVQPEEATSSRSGLSDVEQSVSCDSAGSNDSKSDQPIEEKASNSKD